MFRLIGPGEQTGLGALLPPDVVAVEVRGEVPPDPLFPEEELLVQRAVEKRRVELARGRTCARLALAQLDIAPQPIAVDADRVPVWPAGTVGSITHTHDYCCAVVALSSRWPQVGIDAEHLRPLNANVIERIMLPAEVQQVATLDASIAWPCVVFSIKEAIFKATYPADRRWLDFHDVEVVLDPVRGAYAARVVGEPPHDHFVGRYVVDGTLVMSALVR